ncbi:MAG TPA: hypothetical protein PLF01_03055 [Alphaproteobacteria bacterium]|nr:hypothetical protein [Alphaproteobacteria bacterium]
MKIPPTAHQYLTQSSQKGNAMIYVLIALALLGFLTVTLSRQNNQADGQDLSDEQAELYANEIVQYASASRYAVEMMLSSGSEVNDLNFILPSDANFNTGSNIHKVFHPQGGGLNYQAELNEDMVDNTGQPPGWYFTNSINVEWTPTTANDAIVSALRIKKAICESINKKITGSKDIPVLDEALGQVFKSTATVDLDTSICPGCDGYPMLCVANQGGTFYGFYSIIAGQ